MTSKKEMIGPYEIQGVIGSGGMGVVYRAVQPALRRFVAIKVLPAHLAQNREFVERFQREARSVANLDHPSIVTIYDIGESEGAAYFVMKFLVGDSLLEYIEEEGRPPLDKALLFAEQLADALGIAHASGVIHRDVKPANIIVDPRERLVVLTDFGIALTLKETRLTQPGTKFGSPVYIAPEQLEDGDVDHRADLYSLGSVLYEMLTGRPPYDADIPVPILHQRLKDPEKSVREVNPEVPEAVDQLVQRLMARNPDNRYQQAEELVQALRDLRENPDKPVAPVETTPDRTMAMDTLDEPLADESSGEPVEPEKAEAPDASALNPISALPPFTTSPPTTSGSTIQRLIRMVGMRRIIFTRIGVIAAVLIILMMVIWWTRDSGPSTGEADQQARLEQPTEETRDAGAVADEDNPAGSAALSFKDLGVMARGSDLKELTPETGADDVKPAEGIAEPVVAGQDAAEEETPGAPAEQKDVPPTEVTPEEPADKAAEMPPADSRISSRPPGPPKVSEADVTTALEQAQSSRQSAFESGAPEHAPSLWAAGEGKLGDAAGYRSIKRPDLAKKAYGEAQTIFGQAQDKAAPLAEEARNRSEPEEEELAGLGARIERGLAAGTVESLEDVGQALARFREIAPGDDRLEQYSTRLEDAEKRFWQAKGMTGTFAIAQGVEMEFIWVPPGTFRMGTVVPTRGTHTDESPKHTVVISKGFWLGKYEVTQAQWQAVTGANPSRFKGADHPVDRVSWNDAQAFVARLNDAAGAERFRLPTEAEWEFTCRAGTSWSFFGGAISRAGCEYEDHLAPWAWYCNNSGNTSHPVGRMKPNGWGFHDMHGNVGEWCSDYYDRDYFKNSPIRDPQGPRQGKTRILRGGMWDARAWNCRSAYRGHYKPSADNNSFGLRIVRMAD